MKFFLDTANIEQIKEAKDMGMLDGVTTNPTLVSKENKSEHELYSEIIEICKGKPVSLETTSNDTDVIVKQGQEFVNTYGKDVYVKVANTKEGLKAVRTLFDSGINCNVTLTFSASQYLLAAKAGARVVSPFIGRLDDISLDGNMTLIQDIEVIRRNYKFENQAETLVSSIRHPVHVVQAAVMGAPLATMPFKVLNMLFKHPLTDIGFATFMKDYESVDK
ncbi:MAG: fructose-6-phosphate aldolase [Thaumarchaeota archaeon]|nr:fructose-6-phosphate aldolase [Nitrososphaerota archaeon]|tara:strand:+ start:443 stop:1102 length:660 start_codon:yes stop_codon:yes gene_type:complete